MPDIIKILSDLNFGEPRFIQNRASIADLFKPNHRCGIYVLYFASGEFYVGQAVDVVRRYVQHRRNYRDIVKINFKQVLAEHLDTIEQETIEAFESQGYLLRNISLTSIPRGESDFDFVMSVRQQNKWLADLDFVDDGGERPINPELRRKYHRRYERFLTKPFAKEVIEILRLYLTTGVPAIKRGEISFWSCSCLPTFQNSDVMVYSRMNIFWQEVFTIGSEGKTLWASWHLALSPLQKIFGQDLSRLSKRHRRIYLEDHRYKPGGVDQIRLYIEGKDAIMKIIQDKDILRAVRLFNMRLMKKGACIYNRYHCLGLADNLISDGARNS
jgi:hypothetical protein